MLVSASSAPEREVVGADGRVLAEGLAGGVLGEQFEVARGEAGRLLDGRFEVEVGGRSPGEVYLEYLTAGLGARMGHLDALVEPARPADGAVDVLDEVRRADDHDVLVGDALKFGQRSWLTSCCSLEFMLLSPSREPAIPSISSMKRI